MAKRIRDEVRTGGGVFDTQLTKETTHAILVTGNDPNQKNVKEQISAAVNHGAVVLLRKWLQVCSIHKQLVPGNCLKINECMTNTYIFSLFFILQYFKSVRFIINFLEVAKIFNF